MSQGSPPTVNGGVGQSGLRSRWDLLGIAPTCAQEVAIVPCDGCTCERKTMAVSYRVVEELRPHVAFQVSLPELLLTEDSVARKRCLHAHATLSLNGCHRECSKTLLATVRACDVVMNVDQEQDADEVSHAVAAEVDRLAGTVALEPGQSWQLRPAAQGHARRFEPEPRKASTSQPPAAEVLTAPEPGVVLQRANYFESPGSRRRWRAAVVLILIAIVGGLAVMYWPSIMGLMGAERAEGVDHSTSDPTLASISVPEPLALDQDSGPRIRPTPTPVVLSPDRNDGGDITADGGAMVSDGGSQVEPGDDEDLINIGWIGGHCESVDDCSYHGALCLHDGPLSLCTRQCSEWCPTLASKRRTGSRCVDAFDLRRFMKHIPDLTRDRGRGFCLSVCDRNAYPETGCRSDMRCTEVPVRSRNFRLVEVCLPASEREPGVTPEEE